MVAVSPAWCFSRSGAANASALSRLEKNNRFRFPVGEMAAGIFKLHPADVFVGFSLICFMPELLPLLPLKARNMSNYGKLPKITLNYISEFYEIP